MTTTHRRPARAAMNALCLGLLTIVPGPAAEGIRAVPLKTPADGRTGFTLLNAGATGITFTNTLDPQASASNRVLNNGSGVAAGDYDRDGHPDLFFASLNQGNRLYHNRGDGTYEDVTAAAGLRFKPLFYRAATFADVNGDGWPDLLVGTATEGVQCYFNDGRGHFTDATAATGTASSFANETVALADVDGNGTLDLYVANNRTDDTRDWPRIPVMFVNKKPAVPPQLRDRLTFDNGQLLEYGEPDVLYLNDGAGRFRAVPWTNGVFLDERGRRLVSPPLDWGLSAMFRDLNHDGAPDLYVCNDYWTPDRLWLNDGAGRFRAISQEALRKIPASSMGADIADINRDGAPDIFAVDMLSRSSELRRRQMVAKRAVPPRPGDFASRVQTPQNTLLLNRGDGSFAEIAAFAGVEASDWSWLPVFLDVDLDGYDDLLVTAGHIRDIQDLDANARIRALQEEWRRSPMAATNLQRAFVEARREHARYYPPLDMPVVAFRNRGDLHFDEVTSSWGLDHRAVNHGLALLDLEGDGDLDVVVNRLGAAAAVFRNDATAPRVAVRLRGRPPNTDAIGAKIELLGGAVSNQVQEVTAGGSYMSGHDSLRVFAPGAVRDGLSLRVTWRDGAVTDVAGVRPGHRYDIDESVAPRRRVPAPPANPAAPAPWFTDVSALVGHRHQELVFDDFARQPLLPRKLSQDGPGVAWFDLNADGWEDLIIGTGRGALLAIYMNHAGKAFARLPADPAVTGAARDWTTVLGWRAAEGRAMLLAGAAAYEDETPSAPSVEQLDTTGRPVPSVPAFPAQPSSVGPLALGDVDGDGVLELFVGGQVVPGRYPEPAASQVYRQSGGGWTVDPAAAAALAAVGLVQGAVWTDLDDDGLPELVLACEWGPLKVFQARGGRWREITRDLGLEAFPGLWFGVTAGDFDADGRMDLIAGNWGLNGPWRATAERPLTLYFGDWSGRGGVDLLEAEHDPARGELAPRHLRDSLAVSLPFLAERFPTHAAWSRATMKQVVAGLPGAAQSVSATTLATTVFLNRSGRLTARPLPAEAQFSPAMGLCVADFDGDGREDVFLAQNFFALPTEDSRQDAGRGLLLRGDGAGGFAAVPGQQSGLRLAGEQRGTATADFDHDGRPDLVVTQNGAGTRLYRNTFARPGLRVRLKGPPGNPDGIGARVRVVSGGRSGPFRELHAGSGHWSQDSATVILGTPLPPAAVQVLWPGGKRTEHPVPAGATEITVELSRPK